VFNSIVKFPFFDYEPLPPRPAKDEPLDARPLLDSELLNREGDIIKRTFWPFLLYGLVVGVIAFILINLGVAKF
jgi:hypothetical protein